MEGASSETHPPETYLRQAGLGMRNARKQSRQIRSTDERAGRTPTEDGSVEARTGRRGSRRLGSGKAIKRRKGRAHITRLGSHAYYYELMEQMIEQCRAQRMNWPYEMSKLMRLWFRTRARRALTRKETKL